MNLRFTNIPGPASYESAESVLAPSTIWRDAYKVLSLEGYVLGYPIFQFRPQVAEPIRNKFKIVHRLLLHSYYEYEFLDVAFARTMQIVEMTLRVRHNEIEGIDDVFKGAKKKGRRSELDELIKWASNRLLLEESEERTHLLRKVRNYAVHAKAETLFGVSILQTMYSVVDFVNELYEDIEIRKARHKIETEVQSALMKTLAHGGILTIDGIRLIVFGACALYCSMHENGFRLYVAFLPIFDSQEVNGEISLPSPIFCDTDEYDIGDDTITFTDAGGRKILLQRIEDDANSTKYQAFLVEYQACPQLEPILRIPLAEHRRTIIRSTIKQLCS